MDNNEDYIRILDFSECNRPRERLIKEGANVLSNGELLAILLGTGRKGVNAIDLGNQIMKKFGSLSGIQKADYSALLEVSGIGLAKAAQIKAAVELGNRLSKEKIELDPVISTPADVISLVGYELLGKEQEELWVLILNAKNRLLGKDRLYKGSVNSSSVRVGEVFKMAVRNNAKSIILVHNHPSGDPQESPEDVNLTGSVIEAGKLLDIDLLDHLIIAGSDYVSIRKAHPGLWL